MDQAEYPGDEGGRRIAFDPLDGAAVVSSTGDAFQSVAEEAMERVGELIEGKDDTGASSFNSSVKAGVDRIPLSWSLATLLLVKLS